MELNSNDTSPIARAGIHRGNSENFHGKTDDEALMPQVEVDRCLA